MSRISQHQTKQAPFCTDKKHYERSVYDSKAPSLCGQNTASEELISYFQNYIPCKEVLDISILRSSPRLKLKIYKQSAYYGQFINGKRHGGGIMIYNNQRSYEGHWQCNYKHGKGYEKFPNGCNYEGEYVNGKPEGVGRYCWPNGQLYEGEWMNGVKHGSGMWKGAKGDSYIGEWKSGKAEGYGVHTWINGDRYQGEFKNCLKDGEGVQKFDNGDIYKGLYEKGKPCGFGQYYWSNGSYFKGTFEGGLRHGEGIWKKGEGNSDRYEGCYMMDKKHGYGIFSWLSGNIYKGNYMDDSREGYGEMFWSDGSFYKGEWRNGIQHGQGQIYIPSQGSKKGMFENNVMVQTYSEHSLKVNNSKLDEQRQPNPAKILYNKLNNSKMSINYRKKQYSSKNSRLSFNKPFESNKIINYPFDHRNYNKIVMKAKQNTIESQSSKQHKRTLHSAFYLHKLHHKRVDTANSQGHRTCQQRGNTSYYNNNEQTMDQLRDFTRKKIRNSKYTNQK